MPFLALIYTFLQNTVGALFAYFLAIFGRKYAVATAAVLAFIATTITFIICLKSILAAVIASLVMPAWLVYAIGLFVPSNAISVFSSILSGRICAAAYEIMKYKIDLVAKAN